jgi:hypothetical protein
MSYLELSIEERHDSSGLRVFTGSERSAAAMQSLLATAKLKELEPTEQVLRHTGKTPQLAGLISYYRYGKRGGKCGTAERLRAA